MTTPCTLRLVILEADVPEVRKDVSIPGVIAYICPRGQTVATYRALVEADPRRLLEPGA